MRFLILFIPCIIFYLYPDIDLKVSSLFYSDGFYLKDTLFARFIYRATMVAVALFAVSTLFLLSVELITKREWVKKSVLIYLLLVLAIGPGLIVNEILKNHFGRARPSHIVEFGGDKKFTPAMVVTNQCEKNCSFSSGHAAAAFYFIALSFVAKTKRVKRVLFWLAILWGSLVGFVRIIQGGHFLSDVYCSFFVVYLTSYLLYKIYLKGKDETISSDTGNE